MSTVAMASLFWIGYFERARGVAERHLDHAAAGRRLRLWAYGHIPLYLGVAGIAAGTVALAGHPGAHGGEPWLFAGAAALAMAGVTIVAASHGDDAVRSLAAAWPHFAIAAATAMLPLAAGGWLVAPVCAAASAAQVVASARRRAH